MITEEQARAEFHYALFIGRREHPDVVTLAYKTYGEGSARAQQCIAEVVHYRMIGRLPAWGTVIEKVIEEAGGCVFVHVDPGLLG